LSFPDKNFLKKTFLISLLVIFDQLLKLTIHLLKIEWSLGGLIGLRPTLDPDPLLHPPAANVIASLILITIIIIILSYSHNKALKNALLLIIAGGLSNTIDRLHLNSNLDFINIINLNLNIADIYIVSGSALALIYLFRKTSNLYPRP